VEKVTLVMQSYTPQDGIIDNAAKNVELTVEMADIATVKTLLESRIKNHTDRWSNWETFVFDELQEDSSIEDLRDFDELRETLLSPDALVDSLFQDVTYTCVREIEMFSSAVAAAGARLQVTKEEIKLRVSDCNRAVELINDLKRQVRAIEEAGWTSTGAAAAAQQAYDEDDTMSAFDKAVMEGHDRDEYD
jgi:hypothetical protein